MRLGLLMAFAATAAVSHAQVGKGPDLVVTVPRHGPVSQGQKIGLKVEAGNIGRAPAPGTVGKLDPRNGYTIDVTIEDKSGRTPQRGGLVGQVLKTVDLPPGKREPYVVTGIVPSGLPPGRHALCAVIDPKNRVHESNESNNRHCTEIVVEKGKDAAGAERPPHLGVKGVR